MHRSASGRVILGAIATLVAALLAAVPAGAAYPQGPPNDPQYDPAEQNPTCTGPSADVNAEQHYFYSFMPHCAPLATDPENASGMSVDGAWSRFGETGRPDTVIAYVEGGINWHNGDAAELADKVYLNYRELPIPCTGTPCTVQHSSSVAAYDVNHDGVFNAADYAHDPRVHDSNGNGWIDPEDVIVAFSCFRASDDTVGTPSWDRRGDLHCSNGAANVDNDGDGYPHDISGWDFYDHQNDPATVDATYQHANDQQKQAAAQTNNGVAGAGLCPQCMLLPVKAGAEALDRTDDLAQAWNFAADSGAAVIVSVTADLGYSTFMAQTVERLNRMGVVMAEASNDFDSTDHQGGMFHPFVLPGNGLVSNTQGQPYPQDDAALTTYRDRSNYTSWGTHNMFSAATSGGTTSESTPTIGGVMGLLVSYSRDAAAQGLITAPLSGPELEQVVRETSSPITDPTLSWPGSPGEWNLQYGYGRPNVAAAMQAIHDGYIPPVGWIESPDWYTLYDPTQTSRVPVTGHVEATRSPSYTWSLQYAPGAQPSDSQFITAGTGSGTSPFDGRLGTLDLSRIPQSFWDAPFALSQTKQLETNEQYTVTIRLRVTDASGRLGEDRRTIAVHHDPSLLAGFPLRLGHGGDAPPALADLQGTGRLDIVFGDADGYVHAIDPQTRHELPGWPVHTDATVVQHAESGVDPGHEPIVSGVAVGDLDHTGDLWVVATSTTGRVYVWDAHGHRRDGWPKTLDTGVVAPPIPRPALQYTRLPHQGATASPVLYDLLGNHQLDVVQAGWDGYLHVWNPDGQSLPGWPVKVTLPAGYTPPPGHVVVMDHKLDTTPTIAYLDSTGSPDIVVRSQYTDIVGSGVQPGGIGHVHAYHTDGTPVAGWPVSTAAPIEYYGSAQEFLTEGSSDPAAADVGGGTDSVAVAAVFSPTYLYSGSGQLQTTYGPLPASTAALLTGRTPPTPTVTAPDAPVSFTTSGAFGAVDGRLSYVEPGSGAATTATALLLPGSGNGIQNYERAYDAQSAASLPGFPAMEQGLDFLGAPIVTDVAGDGTTQIVGSADTSAVQAYTGTGGEAAGFPKFDTGWVLWSPAAGDLLSSGHTDVVALTREGYLMVWSTPGDASANTQWWTYHHDEWRTGRYGTDTRPPGVIRNASWDTSRSTLTFASPGGDWYSGSVAGFTVTANGRTTTITAAHAAGSSVTVRVPAGATSVTVQAFDSAGNLGQRVVVQRPAAAASTAAGPAIAAPGLAPTVPVVAGIVVLPALRRARRARSR